MPKKLEKIFEKEYGKKRGDLIFFKWENKHKKDYCPKCRRRTEHIKHSRWKMCKTCGFQERTNLKT